VSGRELRFRSLAFDLDGTLIDSAADLAASVNAARAATGYAPISEATVRGYIGDGVNVLLTRAIPDAARIPDALAAFRAYYDVHMLDRTVVYPGVADALEALLERGARMAVVTNKIESAAKRLVQELSLAKYFGGVVIGSDSGHGRKPEPGPLAAALHAMGARRGDALMLGDGRNDILVARAAGAASCGVGWGIGSEEVRGMAPDLWLDRVEDLLPALTRESLT